MLPRDRAYPGEIKVLDSGFSPLPLVVEMTRQGSALARGDHPPNGPGQLLRPLGRELGEGEQESGHSLPFLNKDIF